MTIAELTHLEQLKLAAEQTAPDADGGREKVRAYVDALIDAAPELIAVAKEQLSETGSDEGWM